MISYIFQSFWLFLLAGLGGKADKTPTEKNTIVAAFMLFAVWYNVSHEHSIRQLVILTTFADG